MLLYCWSWAYVGIFVGLTPAGTWLIRDIHKQSQDVSDLTNTIIAYLTLVPIIEALVSSKQAIRSPFFCLTLVHNGHGICLMLFGQWQSLSSASFIPNLCWQIVWSCHLPLLKTGNKLQRLLLVAGFPCGRTTPKSLSRQAVYFPTPPYAQSIVDIAYDTYNYGTQIPVVAGQLSWRGTYTLQVDILRSHGQVYRYWNAGTKFIA